MLCRALFPRAMPLMRDILFRADAHDIFAMLTFYVVY